MDSHSCSSTAKLVVIIHYFCHIQETLYKRTSLTLLVILRFIVVLIVQNVFDKLARRSFYTSVGNSSISLNERLTIAICSMQLIFDIRQQNYFLINLATWPPKQKDASLEQVLSAVFLFGKYHLP